MAVQKLKALGGCFDMSGMLFPFFVPDGHGGIKPSILLTFAAEAGRVLVPPPSPPAAGPAKTVEEHAKHADFSDEVLIWLGFLFLVGAWVLPYNAVAGLTGMVLVISTVRALVRGKGNIVFEQAAMLICMTFVIELIATVPFVLYESLTRPDI